MSRFYNFWSSLVKLGTSFFLLSRLERILNINISEDYLEKTLLIDELKDLLNFMKLRKLF